MKIYQVTVSTLKTLCNSIAVLLSSASYGFRCSARSRTAVLLRISDFDGTFTLKDSSLAQ